MISQRSLIFRVFYFFVLCAFLNSFIPPVVLSMVEEELGVPAAPVRYDPSLHSHYSIDLANVEDINQVTSDFIRKIEENGFVVLTHAVDPEKVEHTKKLLSDTYQYFKDHQEALPIDDRLAFSNSHIGEEQFKIHNRGASLFDVLNSNVISLCQAFFNGEATISPCAHTRIVNAAPTLYHQQPIHFHADSMYHGSNRFGLNFWTPLEDCGEDKPTLQVCVASTEEVRRRVKFNKQTGFDPQIVENLKGGSLDVLAGLPRYYFPMKKGDIIVFSNWTLHAGYADSAMTTLPRMSMELRYLGPSFDRTTN